MKPIKVALANAERIEKVLVFVNGRGQAHTFNYFEQIQEVAEEASRRLTELNLPLAQWVGAEFVATSGAPVPSAYRYMRTATEVRLLRRATGWFLVGIRTVGIWQKGGGQKLHLTQAQRDFAVSEFCRGFDVIKGSIPS